MSDYTTWHVGMKVVCVNADPVDGYIYTVLPEARGIYTIRRIDFWQWPDVGGVGIWLEEIRRPAGSGDFEVPWCASRFRKVQPRKTDISTFEAILHGARIPEDA